MRLFILIAGVAGLTGCTKQASIAGTWALFNAGALVIEGDCAYDDMPVTTSTDGTQLELFGANNGDVVGTINGVPLVGTLDGGILGGGSIELSWELQRSGTGYTEAQSLTLSGTIEGDVLTGTVVQDELYDGDTGGYACTYSSPVEGVRLKERDL